MGRCRVDWLADGVARMVQQLSLLLLFSPGYLAACAHRQPLCCPIPSQRSSMPRPQATLAQPAHPSLLCRASTTLGEQVPAAALLKSLECSRATLRRSLSIAAGQQPAGSTTTLSLEAAEWEAAVAAAEAARDGAEGGPAALGDVTFSAPGSTAMEWGVGGGPVRRRGLRRFLTARRRHY